MSLYQIFRILVSICIAGAFFLLFRKKFRRKTLYIIAAALLVLADIALCEIPVENAFVTFASPESAAQYVGIDHVSFIIDGADTGLLISGETGEYQERIFPKAQDGWKLSGESATHIRGFYSGTDAAIQLLQYKDTAEYYLLLSIWVRRQCCPIQMVARFNCCKPAMDIQQTAYLRRMYHNTAPTMP